LLERVALDHALFDDKREIGGLYQTFGDEMDDITDEMNEALAA
jgi:hypothetical protein